MAHSSLGLSAGDCAAPTEAWAGVGLLVTGGVLERSYFWVTGQGRKPRPGLGFLPWPAPLSWPLFTRTPSRRPCHTRGAAQSTAESPRLLWAAEWVESLWLLLIEPLARVLPPKASWWSAWDIFLLEITKEMHQSLKLMCVHYRNKA